MTTAHKALVLVLHTLAIFVVGFIAGGKAANTARDAQWSKHIAEDEAAARGRAEAHTKAIADSMKDDREQQSSGAQQGARFAIDEASNDATERVITRDVIRYVTKYADGANCGDAVRDAEFVRVWNNAAQGRSAAEAAEGKSKR